MTRGLILYSGGFDSVALLHKLIVSNDFDELVVLYEESFQMAGEYEIENAKVIFDLFKKKYSRKHKVKLKWVKEKINLEWVKKDIHGREILLFTHLSTIMRHGDIINFYLGWHKSNIKDLDISKKILKWFDKNSREKVSIQFMEEYFEGNSESQVKASTIEYLLDENLFSLPYTGENIDTEAFNKREYWFVNESKDREVAHALIELELFDSKDISKIFSYKTKEQVQKLYNSKMKKKSIKKEKN